MYAIISVTALDSPGIIAAVTTELAHRNVNILDVSQTILDDWFTMILRVDLGDATVQAVQEGLDSVASEKGLVIRVQSEALFNAVNHI